MSNPRISILTASRNALTGLRETSRSIQSQSFRDFEHIVVDGASSDGSQDWLKEQSDHIGWISEPDGGIADALNKGLRMANGEWVLVLHAEDTLVDADALWNAWPRLESSAELVSFDVLFSTSSGDRLRSSGGLSFFTNLKTTIPHQGVFCRRSLFRRIGLFDTQFEVTMDYEFFLRAYRRGASVDVVHKVLSRMPDTGISSGRDWNSLSQRFSEEKKVHQIHGQDLPHRSLYNLYWPLYLTYRRVRSLRVSL